eukprot:gnl/MRDRNA2_/MRDRNA2_19535_c0_seq1.p1 gnl/MRDRNA2_/MRDRNA2_19535_c0~~gnl/MRDRNA2_/MRDRNA2_19535_c0_seq1.p1  ORF type:complete len:619 (+),score=134.45 gnl/MRDRNA2_/MRDRNA2_19535_c0_seq1:185-1858(+)
MPKQKPMRLLTHPKVPELPLPRQPASSSAAKQPLGSESGHPAIPQTMCEESLMKEVVGEVADWLGREVESGLLLDTSSRTEIPKSDSILSSSGTALKPKALAVESKTPAVQQHAALIALAWNEEPKELEDGGFKKSSVIRSSSNGRPVQDQAVRNQAMKLIEATRAAKMAKAVQLAEEALQLEAQIKEEKIKIDLDAAMAEGTSQAQILLQELKEPSKSEKQSEVNGTRQDDTMKAGCSTSDNTLKSDDKSKSADSGMWHLRSRAEQLVTPYLSKEAKGCMGCSGMEKIPATTATTGAPTVTESVSATAVMTATADASKTMKGTQAEEQKVKPVSADAAIPQESSSVVGEPEQEAGSSLVGSSSNSAAPKSLGHSKSLRAPKQHAKKQSAADLGSVMSLQQTGTGSISGSLLGPYANQPKRRPPEKKAAGDAGGDAGSESDTSVKGNLLGPMMSAAGHMPQGPPQRGRPQSPKTKPGEEGEIDASSLGGSESDTSQLSNASSLASSVVNRAAGVRSDRPRRKKPQGTARASVISVKDTRSSSIAGLLAPMAQKSMER